MQDYNIILTHEAIQGITDIADYIELRFGTACADRFQNRLEKELSQLGYMLGYMGGIFYNTHILYKGYAIHKRPFPPSIIFYTINESQNEIHILRILRSERNWKRILSN